MRVFAMNHLLALALMLAQPAWYSVLTHTGKTITLTLPVGAT
jgi:hypothetical protein